MHLVKTMAHVGINQARNLYYSISGRSFPLNALGSMTLDNDDIELARSWLQNRVHWYDKLITSQYEDDFARWNGSQHVFAFMSGRVALSSCIYALGLLPGDEVILPGYTCVVVPNAFHYAGVKTVYCDIELDTYGLDASQIESKITSRTRAILLHHLYGLVCRDYEMILDIAKNYGLKVIEDCAHATGAEFKGIKVGNLGDVAFYSSEQSKVFNTIQGGLAITNDKNLAERIKEYCERADYPDESWVDKQLHNVILNYYQFKHSQRWWLGDVVNILYGYKRLTSTTVEEEHGVCPDTYGRKMPAPIAALGGNQLKKIDYYNERRRQTAQRWDRWCVEKGYNKPLVVPGSVPVYLRYPVLVEPEKKQNLSWVEKELGVRAGVWFVSNIHPAHCTVQGCPNADQAVKRCINLPGVLT